jgi:UDP-N-acetylmuramoylalanine--D-glutamate ligase
LPSSEAAIASTRASLAGTRPLILGLAREGLDLARFLARAGAHVAVTDAKPLEQLTTAVAQLDGLAIDYRLGDPDPVEALRGIDVVYASPGVPPKNPLLVEARRQGVRLSSLIELFFSLCPAPIVGITGSAGKTTTTTLIGEIFRAAGRQTFVGGNIGRPLLGELDKITPQSAVVLELSSFQLEELGVSPHIAVITNVTPNHLDHIVPGQPAFDAGPGTRTHPTMEDYWAAKGHNLDYQGPTDIAVLNADDEWSRKYQPKGELVRFSLREPADGEIRGGDLYLRGKRLMAVAEVPVPGRHNLANVLAAGLAATVAGVELEAVRQAVLAFRGVAHRLELVRELNGVRYLNDSIATAPERSIAALQAFSQPLVLIAGGRDKHLPMEEWVTLMTERCRHVVVTGEMGPAIADALKQYAPSYSAISHAPLMHDAVEAAARVAQPGDIVLLSPGGTSFDHYRDFEARGEDFAAHVRALKEQA